MTIFYNQKTSTLIVNLSSHSGNKIIENKNFSSIYNDDELVGFNIFNFKLNHQSGFIKFNKELYQSIQEITKLEFNYSPSFIVAHVEKCDPIPNTHLHKCLLTDGLENYDVICGANNIKSNINVVFAKNGAILPSGQQINSGELMGYKSMGMICSYKELNMKNPDNLAGIIIVSENKYKIGDEFIDFFNQQN